MCSTLIFYKRFWDYFFIRVFWRACSCQKLSQTWDDYALHIFSFLDSLFSVLLWILEENIIIIIIIIIIITIIILFELEIISFKCCKVFSLKTKNILTKKMQTTYKLLDIAKDNRKTLKKYKEQWKTWKIQQQQ